jgi:hypothetical protein
MRRWKRLAHGLSAKVQIRGSIRLTYHVAQQARDALLHVPLLPAPDTGLGLARPAHNLVGTETFGAKQHDLGSPGMLLRRVAVLKNRLQPLAVRRLYSDGYSSSHPPDSHVRREPGIPFGIQMSDGIH